MIFFFNYLYITFFTKADESNLVSSFGSVDITEYFFLIQGKLNIPYVLEFEKKLNEYKNKEFFEYTMNPENRERIILYFSNLDIEYFNYLNSYLSNWFLNHIWLIQQRLRVNEDIEWIIDNNSTIIIQNTFNFLSIFGEVFLLIAIMILTIYLSLYDYYNKYKIKFTKIASFFSIQIIFFTLILIFNIVSVDFKSFKGLLTNDYFTSIIKIIILLFFLFCLLLSNDYLEKERMYNFEYFLILLLSSLSILTILSSSNLLMMYLSLELQSFCFYILAAFKQYTNFSTEAGMKYFIVGSSASGFLLLGCSLLYGYTGTINFDYLTLFIENNEIYDSSYLNFTFAVIIIALLFKLAAAPFQFWAPDVYEGAPTIVTAIFAIIPKFAILVLLIKTSIWCFEINKSDWSEFMILLILLTIVIGTLGALYQVKLKRLLAYATISHAGFLLIGLLDISLDSIIALLFYIIIYMTLSLNIFSLMLTLRKWNNNLKIKHINEVLFIFKSNLSLSIIFSITLFSFAGIPPLVGFFSKFYIFITGINSQYYDLIIVASLLSVISAFYYIRLIKLMFFSKYNKWIFLDKISLANSLIISYTFLFNFLFLIWPGFFMTFIYDLALKIFL